MVAIPLVFAPFRVVGFDQMYISLQLAGKIPYLGGEFAFVWRVITIICFNPIGGHSLA